MKKMNNQISPRTLRFTYVSMVFLSGFAFIYALLKPGITSPIYPSVEIEKALGKIDSASLISFKKVILNNDTSDRKLSPLFRYMYDDGSQILATMVRVRKRDDFKIETYGLLTKNIDPIYIRNSSFINSTPPSMAGLIDKVESIQTCVIPKTTQLEQSDVRLNSLTSTVERLSPQSNTLLTKVLGTKKDVDYSCLVVTYMPSRKFQRLPSNNWVTIVKKVQEALIK